MTAIKAESRVAVTGIGQSKAARPADCSPLSFTIQACLEAIADAGLDPADIRAISTYPGARDDPYGFSPVSIAELRASLRLELDWYSATAQDSPGHMSAIFNAIAAIAAGLCDHVLVFRTVAEASARLARKHALVAGTAAGAERSYGALWSWMAPFNAVSPAPWYALYAQRHFHEYGTTPEQLAQIAMNSRRMAAHNANAIYRQPITLDDYFASRMISTPLRIYDCDAPIDACTALVLSRVDIAKALRNPPIRFEAIGSAMHDGGLTRPDDLTSFGGEAAASMMWGRTEYGPKDVEVAQLYDGFSILTLHWLEALGLCPKGEAGRFIEGGDRIGLHGELPLNTSGGQLSAGRFHGFGHIHEACVQLWGRGGARQVARQPQLSVVSNGAYGMGCALLSRS